MRIDMSRRKGFIRPPRNRSIGDDAKLILAIADYHLRNIFIASGADPGEAETIRVYAHIRAFFWELYSIGELVERASVRDLENLKSSQGWKEWWSAISEYRNVAHTAFFDIQILWPAPMGELSAAELEHFRFLTDSPSLVRGEIDFFLPAAKRSSVQAQFPQIPDDFLYAPAGKDYLSRFLEYARNIILPKIL
jgi:hypothetical protein